MRFPDGTLFLTKMQINAAKSDVKQHYPPVGLTNFVHFCVLKKIFEDYPRSIDTESFIQLSGRFFNKKAPILMGICFSTNPLIHLFEGMDKNTLKVLIVFFST